MKPIIILTNNPIVIKKYQKLQLITQGTAVEVLLKTRDLVHLGHKLLNHPLAGSVKPNETPYRSLMVSQNAEQLDYTSLSLIEGAIQIYAQFYRDHPTPEWTEKVLQDFQLIDLTLVTSGYQSFGNLS